MVDKERVLVVDDDDCLRGVLMAVLDEDGYPVETVSSAEEALKVFDAKPFPVVITDIRMGGMNGIELLKELKQRAPDTEVVIMTSFASVDTALQAMRLGAYDYLIKPFEELDLITAVVSRVMEKIWLKRQNRHLLQDLQRNKLELEQLNAALKDLAVKDGLTNLYNHRYFQEALKMELARSRRHKSRFSLLFMDVDHFKQYNDANGHPAGDEVLKTISALLVERLRKTDVVARYGGEEFIILLPETPQENALFCAEQIRMQIEAHPFAGRGSQPLGQVTVSIGVASYPEHADDEVELLRHADNALYEAKNKGRNRICVADVVRSLSV